MGGIRAPTETKSDENKTTNQTEQTSIEHTQTVNESSTPNDDNVDNDDDETPTQPTLSTKAQRKIKESHKSTQIMEQLFDKMKTREHAEQKRRSIHGLAIAIKHQKIQKQIRIERERKTKQEQDQREHKRRTRKGFVIAGEGEIAMVLNRVSGQERAVRGPCEEKLEPREKIVGYVQCK